MKSIWGAFLGWHTRGKCAKHLPLPLVIHGIERILIVCLLLNFVPKMWRWSRDVHIWAAQYLKHLKWPAVHLLSLRCDIQRSWVRRWKFGIPLFRAATGQKAESSRSRQEMDTVTKIGPDKREMPAAASSSSSFVANHYLSLYSQSPGIKVYLDVELEDSVAIQIRNHTIKFNMNFHLTPTALSTHRCDGECEGLQGAFWVNSLLSDGHFRSLHCQNSIFPLFQQYGPNNIFLMFSDMTLTWGEIRCLCSFTWLEPSL